MDIIKIHSIEGRSCKESASEIKIKTQDIVHMVISGKSNGKCPAHFSGCKGNIRIRKTGIMSRGKDENIIFEGMIRAGRGRFKKEMTALDPVEMGSNCFTDLNSAIHQE